jgi:tyrosyl-tRNA synthetase
MAELRNLMASSPRFPRICHTALGLNDVNRPVKFSKRAGLIAKSRTYWPRVLDVATQCTLKRVSRCCQIMGRKETDALSASQIIYSCVQTADIFEFHVDCPQLGNDQRKVNMLARDYAGDTKLVSPTALLIISYDICFLG